MDSQERDFTQSLYDLRLGETVTIDELRRTYDRMLPWYGAFLGPWLPVDRQSPILDVPCGAGNLLYTLRHLGYVAATGIDAEPRQVRMAQELGLPASQGDAFAALAACAPASVERIFSLDFLEHVEPKAAVEFARLAHLALTPTGMLICRTPAADGPFASHDIHNDLTHRWALTSNAAFTFMRLAGFDSDKISVHQEAPVPYKLTNRVRKVLFGATTALLGRFLDVVGIGAPRIWTRSMWIVGRK
jgi:2-polyprenyl-3-methyl-5-hydroxy-6-metoxy-1,4-benzoquinol methylase